MTYPSPESMEQAPARTVTPLPTDYRLARKKNGELVLQAGYYWICGTEHGIEWRDRETVDWTWVCV